MTKFIDKLKERWGVESYGQVALILIIFSVTGIATLYVRKFLFGLFGITAETRFWIKVIAWILVVFPSYQLLFLFFGFILGQFNFVWRFEKQSLARIKNLFVRSG